MHVLLCTVFWGSQQSVRDLRFPEELEDAPGFHRSSVLADRRSPKSALVSWWENDHAAKKAAQLLQQGSGLLTREEVRSGTVIWIDHYYELEESHTPQTSDRQARVEETRPA